VTGLTGNDVAGGVPLPDGWDEGQGTPRPPVQENTQSQGATLWILSDRFRYHDVYSV
jgi:hypothetical protein